MLRKFLFLALLCCSLKGFSQQPAKIDPKTAPAEIVDYTKEGSPMPNLILITLDSIQNNDENKWHKMWHKKKDSDDNRPANIFTQEDLEDVKANIFVMIFNPTCSHCANETDMLEKNQDIFKKSKLILVCNPMLRNNLPDFVKQHNIKSYPNIVAGVDSGGFMSKAFLYHMLPQINIYDKNRKLLKIFTGDVPIDSLQKYIQ